MERVLDDAPDQLRREEVGEFRGEGRGEGVEVGALVGSEVASRAHFLQVNVAPWSMVKLRGAADRDTLIDATRLADALILEGCYREARSFSAQQSRVARRVLGPESRDTIYHRAAYAVSLYKDDASRLDEALAIFVDIYQTARRVFGPAHPVTTRIQDKLSEARESQADDAADAAS